VPGAARQLKLFTDTERPGDSPGFSVRESGRAKRLSIKVYPRGRVEVVVPRRTRPHDVQSFVDEHRDWIEQTRASFAAKHPPEPFALPGRVWLAAIGRSFRVAYRPRKDVGTVRFRRHGDLLALTGETSDEAQCIAALKRWLAIVAKEEFERCAARRPVGAAIRRPALSASTIACCSWSPRWSATLWSTNCVTPAT
jgi:predicted metal-dependent hydrolase